MQLLISEEIQGIPDPQVRCKILGGLLRRSSVAGCQYPGAGRGEALGLTVTTQEVDSLGTNVNHEVIGGNVRIRQDCVDWQEIVSACH